MQTQFETCLHRTGLRPSLGQPERPLTGRQRSRTRQRTRFWMISALVAPTGSFQYDSGGVATVGIVEVETTGAMHVARGAQDAMHSWPPVEHRQRPDTLWWRGRERERERRPWAEGRESRHLERLPVRASGGLPLVVVTLQLGEFCRVAGPGDHAVDRPGGPRRQQRGPRCAVWDVLEVPTALAFVEREHHVREAVADVVD